MCTVSALTTGIQLQQPRWQSWPREELVELKKILERLDVIDRKLGLVDCHDDEKASFLVALDARVKALEVAKKPRRSTR